MQEQTKILLDDKSNKINLDNLEQESGAQLGSNPGGKFIDKDSKQEYYIKFYSNEQQARTEFLATKIYAMFGLNVPEAFLDTMKKSKSQAKAKLVFITKWENDLEPICNFNADCAKRITDAKDQLAKSILFLL